MKTQTPAPPDPGAALSYPSWWFPATRERIRFALEAADEAAQAGLFALRDRLVDTARAEAGGLYTRVAV